MRNPLARYLIVVAIVALIISLMLPSSVPRHSDPDPRVPDGARETLVAISAATIAAVTPDKSPKSLDEIRTVPPLSELDAKRLENVTFTPDFLFYSNEFGGGMVAYMTLHGTDGFAVLYHFPKRIVFRTKDELMEELRLRGKNRSEN